MGDYMSIRFSGTVKPEYRDAISKINIDGSWESFPLAQEIGYDGLYRCSFIPCGVMSYPPEEWVRPGNEYEHRTLNRETGEWKFQCSIKSGGEHDLRYDPEIKMFMNEIVPAICEKVDNFELWHEFWSNPDKYAYVLDENTSKLRCEKVETITTTKGGSWREIDGVNGKVKIKLKFDTERD